MLQSAEQSPLSAGGCRSLGGSIQQKRRRGLFVTTLPTCRAHVLLESTNEVGDGEEAVDGAEVLHERRPVGMRLERGRAADQEQAVLGAREGHVLSPEVRQETDATAVARRDTIPDAGKDHHLRFAALEPIDR